MRGTFYPSCEAPAEAQEQTPSTYYSQEDFCPEGNQKYSLFQSERVNSSDLGNLLRFEKHSESPYVLGSQPQGQRPEIRETWQGENSLLIPTLIEGKVENALNGEVSFQTLPRLGSTKEKFIYETPTSSFHSITPPSPSGFSSLRVDTWRQYQSKLNSSSEVRERPRIQTKNFSLSKESLFLHENKHGYKNAHLNHQLNNVRFNIGSYSYSSKKADFNSRLSHKKTGPSPRMSSQNLEQDSSSIEMPTDCPNLDSTKVNKPKKESSVLYVKCIDSKRISIKELTHLFSCFGNVLFGIVNPEKSYALIKFENVQSAILAKENLDRQKVLGTKISVYFSRLQNLYEPTDCDAAHFFKPASSYHRFGKRNNSKISGPTSSLKLKVTDNRAPENFSLQQAIESVSPHLQVQTRKLPRERYSWLIEAPSPEEAILLLVKLHNRTYKKGKVRVEFVEEGTTPQI